jgi:hypothetical protein
MTYRQYAEIWGEGVSWKYLPAERFMKTVSPEKRAAWNNWFESVSGIDSVFPSIREIERCRFPDDGKPTFTFRRPGKFTVDM